jgi:hypothetical protein
VEINEEESWKQEKKPRLGKCRITYSTDPAALIGYLFFSQRLTLLARVLACPTLRGFSIQVYELPMPFSMFLEEKMRVVSRDTQERAHFIFIGRRCSPVRSSKNLF